MFGHKAQPSLLQGLFFNANGRGGLKERCLILTDGIVDACLACQSTSKEQFLTSRYPAVFLVWLADIALLVYIPVQNAK